ncbi:hypothetical protein SAMN05421766_10262 [Zobellia uliginosa]|uniref:RiboL-PSP-HEPN domain-containing protein n=1 Tax=Zobellia uliginosa TaxID=143224 RepID=A0ABY1KL05_9FLAO|nr:hypothetical protein [Zobellia uliginosa]SIS46840.1 hypothetical protein SAMN05421766_10262 [Zobellia uliginosa]
MEAEHPTKYYSSLKEFQEAELIFHNYQKTHNIIRNDYLNLIELTFESKNDQKAFNTLYRACLRELFSLIESDLFNLNRLDSYQNYSDRDKFMVKFKKTFKQIAKTWEKTDIQKEYFDSDLERLKTIKTERDRITHPKSPNDFKVTTIDDFNTFKRVFNEYDGFINKMMNGFFIGMKNYPIS